MKHSRNVRLPSDQILNRVDLIQEAHPKAGFTTLIPRESPGKVCLGLGSKDELSAHRLRRIRALTSCHVDPACGSA